jgi:hypothetical protein
MAVAASCAVMRAALSGGAQVHIEGIGRRVVYGGAGLRDSLMPSGLVGAGLLAMVANDNANGLFEHGGPIASKPAPTGVARSSYFCPLAR